MTRVAVIDFTVLFDVLGIEHRTLFMQNVHSTTELNLFPAHIFFCEYIFSRQHFFYVLLLLHVLFV